MMRRARALNDGMNNTYFLTSNGVETEVSGGLALRTQIREIYAIDALQSMSKSDEFKNALAASGKQKLDGVVGIVPLAGDAFDVMFRANVRNVRLLRRWMEKQPR